MTSRFHRFRVTGTGPFPVDMLRYDCCWPADQDSAVYIAASIPNGLPEGFKHSITLTGCQRPTIARWHSFGWQIKEGR